MTTIAVNLVTTGLCLDMVGVALLAFYSTPTHTLKPDGSEGLDVLGNNTEENKAKYKRNLKITRIAYTLLFTGFLLQII